MHRFPAPDREVRTTGSGTGPRRTAAGCAASIEQPGERVERCQRPLCPLFPRRIAGAGSSGQPAQHGKQARTARKSPPQIRGRQPLEHDLCLCWNRQRNHRDRTWVTDSRWLATPTSYHPVKRCKAEAARGRRIQLQSLREEPSSSSVTGKSNRGLTIAIPTRVYDGRSRDLCGARHSLPHIEPSRGRHGKMRHEAAGVLRDQSIAFPGRRLTRLVADDPCPNDG